MINRGINRMINIDEIINIKGLSNLDYFSKGKRGIVYKAIYNSRVCQDKKVVVKVKKPESKAIGKISHEADFLKKLNKHKIGPKLYDNSEDYLIMELIQGITIKDFFEKSQEKEKRKISIRILKQLRTLDILGIDKEEMHNPYKHIIIKNKNTPIMIDFERAHFTQNPKNITQFVQYLCINLDIDKEKIRKLAAMYKRDHSDKSFNKIILQIEK